MRLQPHQRQPGQVRCSLLFELPDPLLEKEFWADERTLRAYTAVDLFVAGYILLGNLLMTKMLLTAMGDFKETWYMHVTFAANIISCIITLVLAFLYPESYARLRHKMAVCNRLLRFALAVLAGACRSFKTIVTIGSMLALRPGATGGRSEGQAVLRNFTRPLFVVPMMNIGHGYWMFRAKYWLPLQLLAHVQACLHLLKYQPCRLATDPYLVMVLQSACNSMSQLHQSVMGLLFGVIMLQLNPVGGLNDMGACSSLLGSARLLSWYSEGVYILIITSWCVLGLEWELKAAWVRKHLNRQLAYGPFGWPAAEPHTDGLVSMLQRAVTGLVKLPVALALLWFGSLWLVPLLPYPPCEACTGFNTCPSLTPCDGLLCSNLELWAVLILYAQVIVVFVILKQAVRCVSLGGLS